MSIPSYQFPSLEGENIAKRRVMKKAKKGFETEEQRAVKSGQVDDNIKSVYQMILANLEMQLTTISVTEAFVKTMAYDPYSDEDDADPEQELHSYLIGSLGKLVNLSTTLNMLVGRLKDQIIKSGRSNVPSVEISKIFTLMGEVDDAYGEFGRTGLSKSFSVMIDALNDRGQSVPQIDGLLEIWEVSNFDARDKLEKLQKNEYGVDLERIKIPIRKGRTVNPDRMADIASGAERREWSKEEYKLLLELKKNGYLTEDDFTSVYGGDGDRSIVTFSEGESESDEGDSDDDTMSRSERSRSSASSRASSGLQGLFRGDMAGYGLSGGAVYSLPLQPKRVLNMSSGYAYPLRYY